MARIPRVVLPGVPHHVTQRGACRLTVFLDEHDYQTYLGLLAEQTAHHRVEIWAYCLMPNHVHLIAVPRDRLGLSRALGEAHRRYAERINRRQGWRGHLWQERFWSFPMDDPHLRAAVRYVLLNPVRAGLVQRAEDWPHSNAASLLSGRVDRWIDTQQGTRRLECERGLFEEGEPESEATELRRHAGNGRPLGDSPFLARIERLLGRRVRALAPGRPRKAIGEVAPHSPSQPSAGR